MRKITRIARHLLTSHSQVRRCFPQQSMRTIEQAIKASEASHLGEIRFVVEAALDGMPLFNGHSARERAIDLFSRLRIWDTEHNNGILIYLLLADRDVEIVADRGIHAKTGAGDWEKICHIMEVAFQHDQYEKGVIEGIQAVTQHLRKHFPSDDKNKNELSDMPLVL